MMMVNKGGMSYWVPVSDKVTVINCFYKWDQAFRVFLDIYLGEYPERTSELIQYGHIIQMASCSYAWDNVYLYDRKFRRHIEKFPDMNWGVILQQAWTMFLKDRVGTTPNKSGNGGGDNGNGQKSGVAKRLCFSFNRGHCKFGARCKFDHQCGLCGKFCHGTYNCRKAQATEKNQMKDTSKSDKEGDKFAKDK